MFFDNFSGTSQLSSGDASDSICPKGWGMAGYDGDRSYYKLIRSIYGGPTRSNDYSPSIYNEYTNGSKIDQIVIGNPIYLVHSGRYTYDSGKFEGYGDKARYWLNKSYSKIDAYFIYLTSISLNLYNTHLKGTGFSVRRVAKFLIDTLQPII